ncbi:hypothetical protein [Lutibaculum baratangense]|uniref:N-acetyltransferase domain-containing protein n=1 Tax=Lutibaculum baratangense AMV1 TaxID=631454 RepID=V4QS75_9HYPH|nr:hypothetical protein [Lutibaculum baratangense]ESR22622.1 hypothetical protein N177_3758 [Lutibaculum baratangense AMV1]
MDMIPSNVAGRRPGGRPGGPIIRPARLEETGLLSHLHLAHLWCVAMRDCSADDIAAYLELFPGVDPGLVASGRYLVMEADGQVVAGGGWSPVGETLTAALAIAGNGLAETALPRASAILRGVFVCDERVAAHLTRGLMQRLEAGAAGAGHALSLVVTTRDAAMRLPAPGYRDICPLPLETSGARVLPLLQLSKRIGAALSAVA